MTLGEGHQMVIQYIVPDLYFLCPKYLRFSSNGFDVRSKSVCGSGGRGGPAVETNWKHSHPRLGWLKYNASIYVFIKYYWYFIMFLSPFVTIVIASQGWGQVKYLHLVLDAIYRVLGTYLYLVFWNSKVLGSFLYLMAKVLDTCLSTQSWICEFVLVNNSPQKWFILGVLTAQVSGCQQSRLDCLLDLQAQYWDLMTQYTR